MFKSFSVKNSRVTKECNGNVPIFKHNAEEQQTEERERDAGRKRNIINSFKRKSDRTTKKKLLLCNPPPPHVICLTRQARIQRGASPSGLFHFQHKFMTMLPIYRVAGTVLPLKSLPPCLLLSFPRFSRRSGIWCRSTVRSP